MVNPKVEFTNADASILPRWLMKDLLNTGVIDV
jgi:hypothetical protein